MVAMPWNGWAVVALAVVLPAGKAAGFTNAVEVVSYNPGAAGGSGLTDPQVALGFPERVTGEGVFPGVVSPFNPPFLPSEIVSVGEGGHLTLRLATPATDDANHLFGVDLLVFGNAGFVDADFPNGMTTAPAALFGADGGQVEVSSDGVSFSLVAGALADGLFPTLGFLDSGPFDPRPGTILTDFTRPVNPTLDLASLGNLTYAELLAAYDGSGGGAPVDIGMVGLDAVSYVRISVPDDGNPAVTAPAIELDAIVAVPEPGGLLAAAGVALALQTRARRPQPRRTFKLPRRIRR